MLAIYDYFGYHTITYVGDEVRDPDVPWSIILAILGVLVIDLSMNIGIIGVVPWPQAEKSTAIGTDFMQRVWGTPGASVLTILIIWTAFASVYTGWLGASRLPFNAARRGSSSGRSGGCTRACASRISSLVHSRGRRSGVSSHLKRSSCAAATRNAVTSS